MVVRKSILASLMIGLATLCGMPSPALADVKSHELARAYEKGKKNSLVGKASMRDELRCFFHSIVWSRLGATYDINPAVITGELSYGYMQLQFNHYALRWSQYSQTQPQAYRTTWLAVIDKQETRKWEKEKEQKKLAEELGQCAVPLDQLSLTDTELGRAETFLERLTNQPYDNAYPKWVKNRSAWDSYASAWRNGQVLKAAQIAIQTYDGGDTSTFADSEYFVAVNALVEIGSTDLLPSEAYRRAAFMNPERFAVIAGYDPADFRPTIELFKSSSSRLGSQAAGTAARNTAESLARDKCRNAGGKVFRVNSVPTESYKATETSWRTTYEATVQCEFPPKLK